MNDEDEEELSLEDLGAAYARAAALHDPNAFAQPETSPDEAPSEDGSDAEATVELLDPADEEASDGRVTPLAIVEAVLFVGHPRNEPITLERIASLMRDFTPAEVGDLIDELNESYKAHDQAFRVVPHEHGFKMTIAPDVESIRRSFLGKVREARLSQAMVEVLSLVAYQPGISIQKVQDQRGRESAPLLNQLVRRRLLELKRETAEETGKPTNCYYPTERFLALFGLESLLDLPQVEEGLTTDPS